MITGSQHSLPCRWLVTIYSHSWNSSLTPGEVIWDGCQVWPGLKLWALAGEQSADNIITRGPGWAALAPTGSEGGLPWDWRWWMVVTRLMYRVIIWCQALLPPVLIITRQGEWSLVVWPVWPCHRWSPDTDILANIHTPSSRHSSMFSLSGAKLCCDPIPFNFTSSL